VSAPSFVLPSMTGYTETVEKALFLRRFGVPFWGLTYVLGHNRCLFGAPRTPAGPQQFGRYDRPTGRPLSQRSLWPTRRHTWLNDQKGYVATTVGGDCVSGGLADHSGGCRPLAEATATSRPRLTTSRRTISRPPSNTDGWQGTQTPGERSPETSPSSCVFCTAFSPSATAVNGSRPTSR